MYKTTISANAPFSPPYIEGWTKKQKKREVDQRQQSEQLYSVLPLIPSAPISSDDEAYGIAVARRHLPAPPPVLVQQRSASSVNCQIFPSHQSHRSFHSKLEERVDKKERVKEPKKMKRSESEDARESGK